MYAFRDRIAEESGMELIVHVNSEGRAQGINPFEHGPLHRTPLRTRAKITCTLK